MRTLALAIAIVLLAGSCMAFTVKPSYIDVQDTGNDNLPKLNVTISIDCDTKQVQAEVRSNETGDAVEGAMAYLFYTDYSYQALPNPGKSDASGKATIPVPGTLRFLKAMFTLRVDKQGFQSREIEFTYAKCFEAPPSEPEPPDNNAGPGSGGTGQAPPANTTPQQNGTAPPGSTAPSNATPPLPPANEGGNGTANPQSQTPDGPMPSPCPAAGALLLVPLLIAGTRG